MPDDRSFGQIGYEAYADLMITRDFWRHEPADPWDKLPEAVRDAWRAAADAIIESTDEPTP